MNFAPAVKALEDIFPDKLHRAKAMRELYSRNETYYDPVAPDAVFFPITTDDVAQAVKICAEHKTPIIPWGVGTSLEGHALPIHGGVTFGFEKMTKIRELQPENMIVRVEPGVTRESLNEELRDTGLFFPVDPGANATLGGMCATRASGTTALRYGTMKENVLALELVTAQGQVIRTGSRAKKSSAGYDLTNLMVGSEGTLGVITEITLRLQGIPEAQSAAICRFDCVASAVNATIEAIQSGIVLARCELLDALSLKCINRYSGTNYPIKPHLFLEFHGSEAFVREQAERMAEISSAHSGSDFAWSTKTEERKELWRARHHAYWAIKSQWPKLRGMATDICVPISELAGAIEDAQAVIAENGLIGPILGHVGDGNYHSTLLVDPEDPKALARAKDTAARMAAYALSVGGTISGEHGIGIGKKSLMRDEHGGGVDMMIAVKRALDPENILNPGKMLPRNA